MDTRDQVLVEIIVDGVVKSQYRLDPTGESDDDGNPCVAACIFDGANGDPCGRVIQLARECGWDGDWSNDPDQIDWADDDALDWLNEHLSASNGEAYSFGFSDGDFFLANDAWWSLDS